MLKLLALFREKTYEVIRGDKRMLEIKKRALANLRKYNIKTVLIPTIVENLNDDEIGKIFDYALKQKNIISLHIQTLTHTGEGLGFQYDPMNHITVTDVLKNIEEHFGNKINRYDFVPEPNECFLTGVFLTLPGEVPVPIYRLVDMTPYLNKIQNKIPLTMEDIDEMSLKITKSLVLGKGKNKGLIDNTEFIKPLLRFAKIVNNYKKKYGENAPQKIVEMMEKRMLLVQFHSMMDKYTYDQKRVMECTHNWITDDEKIYPFCNYSLFYCGNIKKNLEIKDSPAVKEALEETLRLKEMYNLETLKTERHDNKKR